ncbi:TPA: RAQPRD family integrative conjugative element protein [Pseudomonas aeruginosa]
MPRPHYFIWLAALALIFGSPLATAGEDELRVELAALVRQLEGLERQAERGAGRATARFEHNDTRYHFDFGRLLEDMRRIRSGVQAYLTPVRAQPRDPDELRAEYRLDTSDQEAP